MGTIGDSPLGRATHYPEAYDAALLYAVERAPLRESLDIGSALPFAGEDRWTVWELAWLDSMNRPRVGIVRFTVPATSPRIVESKSVKLYFASLNHARFDDPRAVEAALRKDLSIAIGANVDVRVDTPEHWSRHARVDLGGESIDGEIPASLPREPHADALRTLRARVDETLVYHGFRSVCPVTGQPDYASVGITYRGAAIDRPALAAYLFGYRHHPGFHEHCVERMFVDVMRACAPDALSIEARFTRRGGVDISPIRATPTTTLPQSRANVRQ